MKEREREIEIENERETEREGKRMRDRERKKIRENRDIRTLRNRGKLAKVRKYCGVLCFVCGREKRRRR